MTIFKKNDTIFEKIKISHSVKIQSKKIRAHCINVMSYMWEKHENFQFTSKLFSHTFFSSYNI